MKYSKNQKAKDIVWLRQDSLNMDKNKLSIIVDLPIEFWYKCPICKKLSEWLNWSEYNWFLWCDICNKDYFTFQCVDDIDKQIDIALDTINYVKSQEKIVKK